MCVCASNNTDFLQISIYFHCRYLAASNNGGRGECMVELEDDKSFRENFIILGYCKSKPNLFFA